MKAGDLVHDHCYGFGIVLESDGHGACINFFNGGRQCWLCRGFWDTVTIVSKHLTPT